MTNKERIRNIETILVQEVGRGASRLAEKTKGELYEAAKNIAEHPAPRIVIVTGFYVPTALSPAAETDGPIGAAHLAAALTRTGIPVEVVTDSWCSKVVACALSTAEVNVPLHILDSEQEIRMFRLKYSHASHPVSHLISIERAGPSESGQVLNMRGYDMTHHTAPLHLLFVEGETPLPYTIGIGDGGNEIGMGKLSSDFISEHIEQGETIACRVSCKNLLIAGISNWGGAALAIAIAHLKQDIQMLAGLTTAMDKKILYALVRNADALDGVSQQSVYHVDGFAHEKHATVLEEMLKQ